MELGKLPILAIQNSVGTGWQRHQLHLWRSNFRQCSSFGKNHWKFIHVYVWKHIPKPPVYLPFAYFLSKTPFISIKWLTHAECNFKAPRDPVRPDTREPHLRTPTHVAASTAHLCPADPGTRHPLLSCRLSNHQPPLIPALLCLQIKFQLFVNLCENDKPVPELSFNTQKHK